MFCHFLSDFERGKHAFKRFPVKKNLKIWIFFSNLDFLFCSLKIGTQVCSVIRLKDPFFNHVWKMSNKKFFRIVRMFEMKSNSSMSTTVDVRRSNVISFVNVVFCDVLIDKFNQRSFMTKISTMIKLFLYHLLIRFYRLIS